MQSTRPLQRTDREDGNGTGGSVDAARRGESNVSIVPVRPGPRSKSRGVKVMSPNRDRIELTSLQNSWPAV